jgi:iron(III) transport system substrate-binding protein
VVDFFDVSILAWSFHMSKSLIRTVLSAAFVATLATAASAQTQTLNLYSARHYSTDEALYANFTKATGIAIKRVDADDAGILARLKSEGSASPADVILLVDVARLWKGEIDGLFAPIKSPKLKAAIPAQFRAKEQAEGTAWFGFSTRARVVVYDKTKVKAEDVATYQGLADPKLKGSLCTRSGSHPYNLSLFGAVREQLGNDAATETWLKGLVANMARAPKGGDTDQIRAVGAGECQIAITNSYYLARLIKSDKAEDKALMDKLGIAFPNQATSGTHVNVAGGAVARHSANKAAAQLFLEYLASAEAQTYFADGNNEWPVVANVKPNNPALQRMLGAQASFKAETVSASVVGMNQVKVQQMLDRVGFK